MSFDFTREGKNSAAVGERFKRTAKDGTVTCYEIVSVDASYYMSRQDCADAGAKYRFDETVGWKTPFSAREIAVWSPDRSGSSAR